MIDNVINMEFSIFRSFIGTHYPNNDIFAGDGYGLKYDGQTVNIINHYL
jgi:hypothetical protein